MVLHGYKGSPAVFLSRQLHIVKLVAVHGGRSQGPDLACLHQAVKRFHCFFNGGVIVKAVNDVQVKVIGAQTFQRAFDLA